MTLLIIDLVSPRRASNSSLYFSILNSSFDILATPSITAASATALASQIKTLASKGFGIIYSGPNWIFSSL